MEPSTPAAPLRLSDFLSFSETCQQLADRLNSSANTPNSTPSIAHEIAAWVHLRSLTAYLQIQDPSGPDGCGFEPQDADAQAFGYSPTLQECYFNRQDVASFQPPERYISGFDLDKRWADACGGEDAARRRHDGYVRQGLLKFISPLRYSPFDIALFPLNQVLAIEAAGFAANASLERGLSRDEAGEAKSLTATADTAATAKEAYPTLASLTPAPFEGEPRKVVLLVKPGELPTESQIIQSIAEGRGIAFDAARQLYNAYKDECGVQVLSPNARAIGGKGFDSSALGTPSIGEPKLHNVDTLFTRLGLVLEIREIETDGGSENICEDIALQPQAPTPLSGKEGLIDDSIVLMQKYGLALITAESLQTILLTAKKIGINLQVTKLAHGVRAKIERESGLDEGDFRYGWKAGQDNGLIPKKK